MFALAKSNCPGKAAVHSILFAKDFILQPKQPACLQQLKNNKIQNTTIGTVKMIKHSEQLQMT
jgi:hypothetical protein